MVLFQLGKHLFERQMMLMMHKNINALKNTELYT